MVLEQIVVLMVDLGPGLVFAPLLPFELKTLGPFWAIFGVLAHMIFALAWERSLVLNWTKDILISPFVYVVVDVVSSTTLRIED